MTIRTKLLGLCVLSVLATAAVALSMMFASRGSVSAAIEGQVLSTAADDAKNATRQTAALINA